MKAFIKKLSLLLAVGAMAFGSGLHHEDTKVARAEEKTATLTFDNTSKITSFSTSAQVWEENGITFTNNKASSTSNVAKYSNPVRLYAGSSIEVKIDSGDITKIVFDTNSTTYASDLKTSIGNTATVSVSSDKVTVITDNNPFTVEKLSKQIRLDSITVTYNESTGGGDSGETTKELQSISVDSTQTKTTYTVGESLDLTGMVVTAVYNTGEKEEISSGYTTNPADGSILSTEGTKEITVTYEGKTAKFDVIVNPAQSGGEVTGEEIQLYSTGFESTEGHAASTSYNSTKTTGATGKQWTTYYGTPTTTDKISGSQSLQMRVYKDQSSAPNSKMDFDVENATKITFVAKNTNGINLKLYYSIDKGSNWTLGKSFTISSTANEYSYNVSASSGTIRFKFECDYATVSSTSRLTIDDVCIYGVEEETTATLTSISVDSTQTKTAFIVGETLKAEEIYLNGLYSDGKTRRIETGFTTNPALGTIFTETDISEAKIITVNYEGVASTSFEVSIIADYLTSLSRTNLENTFYEGDLLSIGSGKLIASYASGKEVELTLESEGVEVALNDKVIEIPYTLSLEDNGASIDINFTDGEKTQSISAYKINVFEKLPTTGVSFELVTDASTLKANDRIIIANAEAGQALSINQAGNNRSGAEIAVANSAITSPSADVEIITLENGTKDGTLSFKVNGGYLYAASSEKNYLRTETEKTDNSSWTISIDESGVATIIAQGENTRNDFRFNENGGNPIFSCYASTATMKKVEIYKYSFTNELNNLISRVTDAKTCDDYESASTFRSDYNLLSEYEQSIFNSTVVDSQSEYEGDASTVTLENKLAYMEYLSGLEKQSEGLSSNLLSNITSSNNILIILVVGLLGLTSILGYYFLNKKKYVR